MARRPGSSHVLVRSVGVVGLISSGVKNAERIARTDVERTQILDRIALERSDSEKTHSLRHSFHVDAPRVGDATESSAMTSACAAGCSG